MLAAGAEQPVSHWEAALLPLLVWPQSLPLWEVLLLRR
jgi:hypothetical protein